MKLIVHLGLHKTASTYVQHLLNGNHAALADAGLWYEPQPAYPAHHAAAWRLLAGDGEPLVNMLSHARDAGCTTTLLSSEDLEGALYDERPVRAIEHGAAACGVTSIEWHVVLRDAGQYFASLFAQLPHHVYADALSLFYDVMRRGYIHVDRPLLDSGAPYWYYCFDPAERLARFATVTGQRPIAHDYRDAQPFPGWRMLDTALLPLLTQLPGDEGRNMRMDEQAVANGYVMRMVEAVTDEADQAAIIDHFTDSLRASLNASATYADIIGKRYAASLAAALADYGHTA